MIGPHTWRDLCVATEVLGIPRLRAHALHKLQEYVRKSLVGTWFLRDEASVFKSVTAVQILYVAVGKNETPAREEVLKLCFEHFTELEKHATFCKFTDAHPSFLREVLGHAARQKAAISR